MEVEAGSTLTLEALGHISAVILLALVLVAGVAFGGVGLRKVQRKAAVRRAERRAERQQEIDQNGGHTGVGVGADLRRAQAQQNRLTQMVLGGLLALVVLGLVNVALHLD